MNILQLVVKICVFIPAKFRLMIWSYLDSYLTALIFCSILKITDGIGELSLSHH